MFKNYFKTASRNLLRNKVYSFINIFGLAIGTASCILIAFFLRHERSYDKFHKDSGRIYRVLPNLTNIRVPSLPFPLVPALAREYSEITHAVRLYDDHAFLKIHQDLFKERILYADAGFFEMFNFPLKSGNPRQVLANQYSVVLSDAAAKKYFGDDDPIGQTIAIAQGADFRPFVVGGVVNPIPTNSSIQFDFLLPFENLKYGRHAANFENWIELRFLVTGFIRLHEAANVETLKQNLPAFIYKYLKIDLREGNRFVQQTGLKFQPFSEYHLGREDSGTALQAVGNVENLYILAAIATLILLVACFNFITLTIGSSSGRFTEVGMRKVFGAQRSQLVQQFWLEAILLSLLALILGAMFAELVLPQFNELSGNNLSLDFLSPYSSLLILLPLTLVIGVIAGSYPALVISRFSPVEIFKGKFEVGRSNPLTRTLITIQFALSICLIIIASMIARQLHYMKNHDLGFSPQNVIVIPTQVKSENKFTGTQMREYYKHEIAGHPNVISITSASGSFQRWFAMFSFFTMEDGAVGHVGTYGVDADFIRTLQLKLQEGRDFRSDMSSDIGTMIVNETFMETFKDIARLDDNFPYRIHNRKDLKIIGVVKDFNFQSLKKQVMPAALVLNAENEVNKVDCILIRIRPQNTAEMIATLKHIWEKYRPDVDFEYNFMDEDIAIQYKTEERWRRIITYASIFAILIASLGLFGLTTLSLTRRKQEIGIRKVLGATVANVVTLLSKDFVKQVLLALGIALLTVSTQAIRAALANPVESLRYE